MDILLNYIKDLIRYSNDRIDKHNSQLDSSRRKVQLITDKELRMTMAILILGKQEKGTMEFSVWFQSRLRSPLNMFREIGGFSSVNVKFISYSRFSQILRDNNRL